MVLNKVGIRPKLISLFLLVSLIPMIVVSALALVRAQAALFETAYNNLGAIHEIKRYQIETYFRDCQNDVGVLAEAIVAMRAGALDAVDEESEGPPRCLTSIISCTSYGD